MASVEVLYYELPLHVIIAMSVIYNEASYASENTRCDAATKRDSFLERSGCPSFPRLQVEV